MTSLTWLPPNNGDPVIFSRDSADYKLLRAYTGFAEIPSDHIYAEKAPMRHGKKRKYSVLKERPVSFDIQILSDNLDDLQDKVSTLSAAMNPLEGPGVLKYTKENGSEYHLNCIGVAGNPALDKEDRSQTNQKATIQLIADEDPFWHAGSPTIVSFDATPAPMFPWTLPWTIAPSTAAQICTNDGSTEAPVIVVFKGPLVNPSLTCVHTVGGFDYTETISFTITLAAGDILIVNTDPDIKTARYYPAAGGDNNAHKYMDPPPAKLWQLPRGISTVRFNNLTSSTGSGATMEYTPRFVGV